MGWSEMCWGSEKSCRFHCLSRFLFHECVGQHQGFLVCVCAMLGILEKQLRLCCDR